MEKDKKIMSEPLVSFDKKRVLLETEDGMIEVYGRHKLEWAQKIYDGYQQLHAESKHGS